MISPLYWLLVFALKILLWLLIYVHQLDSVSVFLLSCMDLLGYFAIKSIFLKCHEECTLNHHSRVPFI